MIGSMRRRRECLYNTATGLFVEERMNFIKATCSFSLWKGMLLLFTTCCYQRKFEKPLLADKCIPVAFLLLLEHPRVFHATIPNLVMKAKLSIWVAWHLQQWRKNSLYLDSGFMDRTQMGETPTRRPSKAVQYLRLLQKIRLDEDT